MDRREFLGATGSLFCAATAGCLGGRNLKPDPRLLWVELENHRRESGYEFAVRIEADESTVFETTRELGAAGSGDAATVVEEPVEEPGAYTVSVEAGGHDATVETGPLVTDDEPCLALKAYLGASTLNVEHSTYTDCG